MKASLSTEEGVLCSAEHWLVHPLWHGQQSHCDV
jgi:hypothetical protein